MDQPRIAFIGSGVMGASTAGHLLDAGHSLSVHTRTRSKAEKLLARGATWADSPGEAVAGADVVISIVGYPQDVEQIYLEKGGILDRLDSGCLAIDMTTSSPRLAREIAKQGVGRGIEVLDAPVSGGDKGAREAKLSIMVGGESKAFDRALPILQLLGANIQLQGPPGSGQHTKMCNQIAIASGMVAIGESLAYAKAANLDPETVLLSISSGAAGSWSMSNLVPRALAGDCAPGFYVKHFIKDMGIALRSAEEMSLDLPGLAMAKRLYDQLAANGHEDEGTQALFRMYLEK